MSISIKKIFKRFILGLFVLLIGVVILSVGAIFFFGKDYAHQEITSFLNKKTNGNYTVEFSELKINPIKRSISFYDFHIVPTANNNDNLKLNFKASNFLIKRINLKKLLKNKELIIQKIEINKPIIQFKQEKKQVKNNDSFDKLIDELKPFINQSFKSIQINKIELIDAGLLQQKSKNTSQQQSKKTINFNVGIDHFYTDSVILSNVDDFFEASDIFLSINDYHAIIGDSLHQLNVDELIYSIKNQGISAHNIALIPTDTIQTLKTKYWVNIPDLYIQSKNIDKIFQTDSIWLDTLLLNNAQIKVIPPDNAAKMNFKEIREYDLFQLVKNDFKQLKIGYLNLQANQLSINRTGETQKNRQIFENIQIELEGFQLDSTSYSDTHKILYGDKLLMKVGKYTINFSDQIHTLQSQNIHVSSETNSLNADQLEMWPTANKTRESTHVTLFCDSIRMNDVDLLRLYHKREMPLQQIAIFKPNINLLSGTERKAKKQSSNSLIYHFIGNYIKGVYSNLVTIDQGSFVIRENNDKNESGIIRADFDFRLTDFSLDSISANKTDKLFFATNFELQFNDYKMQLQDQLHGLTVDKVEVSSLQKMASIRNLHLSANEDGNAIDLLKKYNKNELYEIKIPYLNLRNTNIHQAFFNKKLNINYFSIIEPSIYFEFLARNNKPKKEFDLNEFYGLFKNYINDIRIGSLKLNNGKFKLVNHDKRGNTISFDNKFNLELDGFRFNKQEIEKNRLLFSDDFELTLKDYLFRLSDDIHYLQAKEIGFSTRESEVFIRNAILYPDITSSSYQKLNRHLHITVPDFRLKGIDIKEAFKSKKLNVNLLKINRPNIKIYHSGNSHKKLNFKDITIPLPKKVGELSLNRLEINDGEIIVINTVQHDDKEIARLDLNLTAQNVHLAKPDSKTTEQLTVKNISTSLKNIEFKPLKGKYRYTISELNYNKRNNHLEITNLEILPKDQSEKSGLVSARFPKLKIRELNSHENKRRNCLHTSNISINDAYFHFVKPEEKKNPPNLYDLKLNEDLFSIINEIYANKVDLKNATLHLENSGKQKVIENIQLTLNQFRLNEKYSGKLLASESINLSIKKLKSTDRNKRYDFLFNEINLSGRDSRLSLRGIQILPRYSKNEFQKVIPYQTDYYEGEIGLIEAHNIDIKQLIQERNFIGNKIVLKNARLDIYRDMRKGFNENQRPAMPQDLIRQFENPFYFDSVIIKSSDISYAEQLDEMPKVGQIRFNSVNASVYPFTNMAHMLSSNPMVSLYANALVMNKAKFQAKMNFDMLSSENKFQVEGSIEPFQLNILNPMTKNAAQVGIRSGQLNRFEFHFEADNTVAKGKLKFAYDDLKINILSFKDGSSKESKFASFLANSLVVKSKNPRTRILLPDPIYFERDTKRSILNYWWKSMFSGIKNTFGMKEKKVQK